MASRSAASAAASDSAASFEQAADYIRSADALLIAAGAGMGVDSGLPDFRGDEGFWRAYPPMKHLGLKFHEMSTPSWFDKDPELAWGFFGHRYGLYAATEAHDGFRILREWGERCPDKYFVFTSNIDGQFQKSGYDPNRVLECHGSIHHLQCTEPSCHEKDDDPIFDAGEQLSPLKVDTTTFRAPLSDLPHCRRNTEHLARPNVLMFNDDKWASQRTDAQEERFTEWTRPLKGKNVVVVEMGAGLAVPTVRYASESLVRFAGAKARLVRINPREPEIPKRIKGVSIAGPALATLNSIAKLL